MRGVYIRDGNGLSHGLLPYIFHHVLDEHRALGNLAICTRCQLAKPHNVSLTDATETNDGGFRHTDSDLSAVGAHELDLLHLSHGDEG